MLPKSNLCRLVKVFMLLHPNTLSMSIGAVRGAIVPEAAATTTPVVIIPEVILHLVRNAAEGDAHVWDRLAVLQVLKEHASIKRAISAEA